MAHGPQQSVARISLQVGSSRSQNSQINLLINIINIINDIVYPRINGIITSPISGAWHGASIFNEKSRNNLKFEDGSEMV
jgi:hypothetical protein